MHVYTWLMLEQIFLSSSLILDMKSGQYCGSWGEEESTQEKKTNFIGLFLLSQNQLRGVDWSVLHCLVLGFFPLKYLCCFCSEGRYRIPYKQTARRSVGAEIKEESRGKKPFWSKEKAHMGPTYQVSVDDRVLFQISHPFTHIQAHPQQGFPGEAAPLAPEVVGQAAVLHELEHQADGSILKAHPVKLDQLGVRQLPVGQGGKEVEIVPAILTARVLHTAVYATVLHPAHCKDQLCRCVDQGLNIIPF